MGLQWFEQERVQRSGELAERLDIPELAVVRARRGGKAGVGGLKLRLRIRNRFLSQRFGSVVETRELPGERVQGEDSLERLTGSRDSEGLGYAEPVPALTAEVSRALSPAGAQLMDLARRQQRVVVVTGAARGQGVTTLVVQMGMHLAAQGQRVLLIDAHGRDGRLHESFGLSNIHGFTDILKEAGVAATATDPETLARSTEISNLYLIPGGEGQVQWGRDPLQTQRVAALILRSRRLFDTILIDAPAASEEDVAGVFSGVADGVALVVRAGSARWTEVELSQQRLQAGRMALWGAILTGPVGPEGRTLRQRWKQCMSGRSSRWKQLSIGLAAALLLAVSWSGPTLLPGSRGDGSSVSQASDGVTVLPAHIRPSQAVTLRAPEAAEIAELLVKAGTEVSAGQPLLVLRSADAEREREAARARLELLLGQAEIVAGGASLFTRRAERQRMRVEAARERLQAFSLEPARKNHERAQRRAEEIRGLFQQNLATRSELEQADAQVAVEAAQLRAADEHLSRLREEYEGAEADLRLMQPTGAGAPGAKSAPGEAGADLEIQLRDARQQLLLANQRLGRLQVRAAAGGVVLWVGAQPGEHVLSGAELMRIGDLSQLAIDVPVSARVATRVREGQRVTVLIPTDPPSRARAQVSSISLIPEGGDRAYTVRVLIPNPRPGTVLAGLEGAVEFPHRME
jgi:Mrp family chromosome partitioning ATPase/multidrug resistance efflux pump